MNWAHFRATSPLRGTSYELRATRRPHYRITPTRTRHAFILAFSHDHGPPAFHPVNECFMWIPPYLRRRHNNSSNDNFVLSFIFRQPYGITFKCKNVIRKVSTRDRCRIDAKSMKWIPMWWKIDSWQQRRPLHRHKRQQQQQQHINLATMAYSTIKIKRASTPATIVQTTTSTTTTTTTQKITNRSNKPR